MDLNTSMMLAASGMRAQSSRMRVIAENIANANSTSPVPNGDPYRRKVATITAKFDDQLGATMVVHSMTKYLNGHSDVVGGCVMTSDDALAERLHFLQKAVGAIPSPFDCYLVLRGLKTLAIRVERHVQNATKIAHWLTTHPQVERVIFPGLESHPGAALARKQMKGPGGMISVGQVA